MPAAAPWLSWLEQTAPAVWARQATWAYPALEIGHILGFIVLVGAAVMFDLRLLGFTRALSVAPAADHLLRSSRWSLLLVVPTGALLFAAHASATWANPAFRLKLLLLIAAAANALVFQRWNWSTIGTWQNDPTPPLTAKIAAVLSLLLWTGVVTCGRLIAYL